MHGFNIGTNLKTVNPPAELTAGDQSVNCLAAVGDGDRPADGAHFFVRGVYADELGDGGKQVGDGDRIGGNLGPFGVGAAVGDAAARAAASEHRAPGCRVVVTAL